MPQQRVLFLDSTRLTIFLVKRSGVHCEARFGSDPAGLAAFGDFLTQHRRSVYSLLADIAEEGYQVEDVPHSSGKDREAIIRRKLAQHFYGTSFSLAHSQGRQKTGRRDERLLLIGLTQPHLIEPWLGMLHDQKAKLGGVYALSQTICNLSLGTLPPKLLLLTQTAAGLRQTFFLEGGMRFSRLTPLIESSPDATAVTAANEAFKMHQYLASQRLIDQSNPLPTWLLTHPADAAAMRARCRSNASLQFEIVDLFEVAGRAGLRSPLETSRADALFCRLLLHKPPKEQFAPTEERQHYRLWQARFALGMTSAAIFFGSLLFAADRGLDIANLRETIEQVQRQTALDQARYAEKMQGLPTISLSTSDLRDMTDRFQQISKRAQGPGPLLEQLSRSLDAFPQIAVDRIEWSVTEQPGSTPTAGNASAPVPAPKSTAATGPFNQVIVAARLPIAMVGDHRGQLATVSEFRQHLGTTGPDTTTIILQPPVDTQSGKTLKSSDEKSTPEPPKFVFLLARKL